MALAVTDLTAVRLAILMPAVNGVIGLPLTALALYGAVNRYFDISRTKRVLFALTVILMFISALVTVKSLIETIQT